LDLLESLNVKDITFYDDALLFKKEKHFLPLFEKIIEKITLSDSTFLMVCTQGS